MILQTPEQIKNLLQRSRSIAVVGASAKPERAGHYVYAYLRDAGYDAVPVSPTLTELLGVKAFPTLTAYAGEHGAPDIVDVFRNPSEVLPIVDEAIAVGAKAVWFQLGVVNEEAIGRADKAGLDVVVDKCIKVEHRDLI